MPCHLRRLGALTLVFAAALLAAVSAQAQQPLRIGVITFLSGPAAGPFGVPAKNASDLVAEVLNKGGVVPGYEKKGFGGRPIELVYVDEAGGPTKVVTEYRNLVERQNVDLIIGVISSGDCLAVAPVAEELKKFTVLFDCATYRIFEEASYKYVFRTTTMATQENVAAVRYVAENFPNLKTYSGINPNYAWGQDAWSDFTESMKILKPQAQIATNVTPKLGAGQYGTEISALLGSGAEIIQNSLWGGDLEAYIMQAAPRGAPGESAQRHAHGRNRARTPGRPAARRHDHRCARAQRPLRSAHRAQQVVRQGVPGQVRHQLPSTPLTTWPRRSSGSRPPTRRRRPPTRARSPSIDDVIAAFEYLKFESPAGTVNMALGKGHQAVQHVPYGTVKKVDGKVTLINIKYFPPDQISPPDGVKSLDWIRSGFKRK